MRAVMIILLVLLLLVLLLHARVGGDLRYDAQGMTVRLKLGVFWLKVFPMHEKKRKKKPEMKKKSEELPAPTAKGGTWAKVREFLPMLSDAAGRAKEKIRIDHFDLDLTIAMGDPALAALAFGGANATLGIFVGILEQNFNVKERNIRTQVDFDQKTPTAVLFAAFSLKIYQAIAFYAFFASRMMGILSAEKKRKKQEEAVQNGT